MADQMDPAFIDEVGEFIKGALVSKTLRAQTSMAQQTVLRYALEQVLPEPRVAMQFVADGDVDGALGYVAHAHAYRSLWVRLKGSYGFDFGQFLRRVYQSLAVSISIDKDARFRVYHGLIKEYGIQVHSGQCEVPVWRALCASEDTLVPILFAAFPPVDLSGFVEHLGDSDLPQDLDPLTMLDAAVRENDVDAIDAIMAFPDERRYSAKACVMCIRMTRNIKALDRVLAHMGSVPKDLLGHAIATRWVDGVASLLDKGASPNQRVVDVGMAAKGDTVLMLATRLNCPEIVKALIDARAKINVKNRNGTTALHIAAYHGYTQCVELLITRHDLRKNLKKNNGATALDEAKMRGHDEIVALLQDDA